ncbi:MAG: hypothetical protein AB7G88_07730 [Thermomicrobiales bacterium]
MKSSTMALRIGSGVLLMLAMAVALVTAPSTLSQSGNSSIEVHSRVCPTDYAGANWYDDCHNNPSDPGLPFTFANGVTREGTTNENGNVGFGNLPSGTYEITGGAPGEFTDYFIYCSDEATDEQISIDYITGGFQVGLETNTNVVCDWYTVPLGQDGEPTATALPENDDGSIEVHNRVCPTDYSGDNWFEDCHANVPDPGLPFTFSDGVTRNGTTNENGNVGFAGLPSGIYEIIGGAPGEFTDYFVYCAEEATTEQVPVEYVTGGIQLELSPNTNLVCDWYTVPLSQNGEPTATSEPAAFDLPIYALQCAAEPGQQAIQDFVTRGILPDGCEQLQGVSVSVTDVNGQALGACVTEATAPCYVRVPIGQTVIATQDLSTVPPGFVPIGGGTREVGIEPQTEASTLFVNVRAQPTATVPAPPTQTPLPEGRSLLLIAGSCENIIQANVVLELDDLRLPEGDLIGQSAAITAESSTSTVERSLEQLTSEDHAIVAYGMNDFDATGDPEACAPLGGVINSDGELIVGLVELNNSDLTGIVYLAPADADEMQTVISAFLAEGLSDDQDEMNEDA